MKPSTEATISFTSEDSINNLTNNSKTTKSAQVKSKQQKLDEKFTKQVSVSSAILTYSNPSPFKQKLNL